MVNEAFQWQRHPEAEAFSLERLEAFCQANRYLNELREQLFHRTSTRLFDWIDYLSIEKEGAIEKELNRLGYSIDYSMPLYQVFYHPGAQLPRIVLNDPHLKNPGVAIKVDSIENFLLVRGEKGWIEGSPFSQFRRCCVNHDNEVSLWVIERRGTRSIEPKFEAPDYLENYLTGIEKWKTRHRSDQNQDEAMQNALSIAGEIVKIVNRDIAAWIVLEVEREYWEAKNRAAQIQKDRQDQLGMGWANHDHHTFRSSRKQFHHLVRLFEILGFHCRERFYAGQEAGWGAQVMENPNCGLVLFLDVDLAPNELEIDFAHQPLLELENLGTVGLWSALHGDSILKSGMHHLEAQFMFNELEEDLKQSGIGMMQPFSSFTYLKQAFTAGEIWKVDPQRIQNLLKEGKITQEQAEKFAKNGAVGSHLENLQRREGYKGFNQKNVNFIIEKTDPRKI